MPTYQQKLGQMLLVGFDGLTAPDYILKWLETGQIGGVILFARNVQSPRQLLELTTAIHRASPTKPLIAIDQEGGTVARLRTHFTESPGALALASNVDDRLHATHHASYLLAQEMQTLGINWTYAPVVDINYNAANPTVGTRSFGSTVADVSQLAAVAIQGFQEGGVAACAKHFPGLGDTAVDTHKALAVLDTPLQTLLERDLQPYHTSIQAGLKTIMTTHTLFTALDENYPATLSPHIIQRLIREELAFEGVVVSDCMEMKAISDHHTPAQFTVQGVKAGLDIVLISHTQTMQDQGYKALVQAYEAGEIDEERLQTSYQRIQMLKDSLPDFDITRTLDDRLANIATNASLASMRDYARKGTCLLRDDEALRYRITQPDARVLLIEFASHLDSDVVEQGGQTGLITTLHHHLPQLQAHALQAWRVDEALLKTIATQANQAEIVIIATRNAHLQPDQADVLQQIAQTPTPTALVALRNPYDANLVPNARLIITTCGDSTPSIDAVASALMGEFVPSGRLPVDWEFA